MTKRRQPVMEPFCTSWIPGLWRTCSIHVKSAVPQPLYVGSWSKNMVLKVRIEQLRLTYLAAKKNYMLKHKRNTYVWSTHPRAQVDFGTSHMVWDGVLREINLAFPFPYGNAALCIPLVLRKYGVLALRYDPGFRVDRRRSSTNLVR